MPETLKEFIEKKIEELVENPEFHFHPSVIHFFRRSLRECAEKTVEALYVDGEGLTEHEVLDYSAEQRSAWLGTDPTKDGNHTL